VSDVIFVAITPCGCCLPICLGGALLLVSQVAQNLKPYATLMAPQVVDKTRGWSGEARHGDDAGDRARTDGLPRSNQNASDKWARIFQ
jgi:hypothetical protein